MKRDLDLCHEMLVALENESEGMLFAPYPDESDKDMGIDFSGQNCIWAKKKLRDNQDGKLEYSRILCHHASLLLDANLAEGEKDGHGRIFLKNPTWDGYEMLDATRTESVWTKAKKQSLITAWH